MKELALASHASSPRLSYNLSFYPNLANLGINQSTQREMGKAYVKI